MPRKTFPRDRFDALPARPDRVGAHRMVHPRMRWWIIMSWAIVATIVLIATGIFGSLVVSGRVTPFPTPTVTTPPPPVVAPVVDTTYSVLVLNATPVAGLATQTRELLLNAGWPPDIVTAGDAGSEGFAETTVYYPFPEDEAAALGLAEVIGGAGVSQSTAYQPPDDPGTEVDETLTRQLVVVVGLDRAGAPPAP